jgi:hypothetical protein
MTGKLMEKIQFEYQPINPITDKSGWVAHTERLEIRLHCEDSKDLRSAEEVAGNPLAFHSIKFRGFPVHPAFPADRQAHTLVVEISPLEEAEKENWVRGEACVSYRGDLRKFIGSLEENLPRLLAKAENATQEQLAVSGEIDRLSRESYRAAQASSRVAI